MKSEVQEKKKGNGCLKLFLIVVTSIFIFIFVAGYLLYKNAGSIGRNFGAQAVEAVAQQIVDQSDLPDIEKKELLEPFTHFADDIRAGKVDAEQALAIVEEIANGPTWALLTIKSVIIPRVMMSGLSEKQKDSLELQFRRLGEGVRRGVISVSVLHETLKEVFPEIDPEDDTEGQMKTSDKDLLSLGERVKEIVDKAGIENEKFKFNIASQMSKVIESSMNGPNPSPK